LCLVLAVWVGGVGVPIRVRGGSWGRGVRGWRAGVMGAGMCGWSCRRGWMAGAGGSGGAVIVRVRRRLRCWRRCGVAAG